MSNNKIYLPRQVASLIIYAFKCFYENNTPIGTLQIFDFASLMSESNTKSKNTLEYITDYNEREIYQKLNRMVLLFDSMNVKEDSPKFKSKRLVVEMLSVVLNTPEKLSESKIHMIYVTEEGFVTTKNALKKSGAVSPGMIAYWLLTTLGFSTEDHDNNKSYLATFKSKQSEISNLLESKRYSLNHPFDPKMTRKNDPLELQIDEEKACILKEMYNDLIQNFNIIDA